MNSSVILAGLFCIFILIAGCTALEKGKDLQSLESGYGGGLNENDKSAPTPAPDMKNDALMSRVAKTENESSKPNALSPSEQKIIRTADIRLEVSDVQKTSQEIARIATTTDGIIQSSSVNVGLQDHYTGTVTIRIPSDRFDEVLTGVKGLGKLTSSSVSADDVTEEYLDLTAQKTALENQLAQYNRIMTQAVNVSEILEVQREIERVQVELDRITGRIQYLDSRVSLSTITIHLSEPAQVVTSTGYSMASVLSDALSGFVETVVWLVIVIMTVLPLGIVGLAGYLVYRKIHKNREQ